MANSTPIFSENPGEWFRVHQRRVTQIAVPVLLIALGIWFTLSWQARKAAAAEAALDIARNVAEANNLGAAAAQLQQVIERYHGTTAADEAVLSLNQVRMINGQFELAVANLREYLASHPAADFAVPANGLLGAALESSGRPAEAGAAYEAASRSADVDYLKADYLVRAGRAYMLAGKADLAVAALDTVAVRYQQTPVYTEAAIRLAELTKGALPKRDDALTKLPQPGY